LIKSISDRPAFAKATARQATEDGRRMTNEMKGIRSSGKQGAGNQKNRVSGENTSDMNNSYMFTGRNFDNETGLYYYRARYYSPEIGRLGF
jgi:hypothetical protein